MGLGAATWSSEVRLRLRFLLLLLLLLLLLPLPYLPSAPAASTTPSAAVQCAASPH